MSRNATFYVSGDAPLVEIPLRLTSGEPETSVLVVLDGKAANMIALQDDTWRSIRVVLPAEGDVIFETPPDELWEKLAPPTLPG